MMHKAVLRLVVLLVVFPRYAVGAERLRVTESNAVETAIKDCIRAVERAANAEDLDGFMMCFTEKLRKTCRRRVGILFAQHVMGLEIADMHFLEYTDTEAHVAIKYQAILSAERTEYVSSLKVVKEAGQWRISKETILTASTGPSRSESSPFPQQLNFGGGGVVMLNPPDDGCPADIGRHNLGACANGRCGVR